ncbi:MAG: hypothetical protein M1833_001946 [Piccolia ochrophora]|nr:MAG: hypothetical protein M1833_001946 [Piccolia ochrophora]
MDAKPHRAVRQTRVQGDENAPLESSDGLQQHYKSTGTLLTTTAAGPLRVAAKRIAFGDVSNTVKYPSKDDSTIPGKDSIHVIEKSVVAPVESSQAPLLRPAQRPLSVTASKFLPSETSNNATTSVPTKPLNGPASNPAPAPNTRTAVGRKGPAVFKDPTPPISQTSSSIPLKEAQTTTSTAPVHQNLAPRHHKSQQHLRTEQPILRRTKSRFDCNVTEQKEDERAGDSTFSDEVDSLKPDQMDASNHNGAPGHSTTANQTVTTVEPKDHGVPKAKESEQERGLRHLRDFDRLMVEGERKAAIERRKKPVETQEPEPTSRDWHSDFETPEPEPEPESPGQEWPETEEEEDKDEVTRDEVTGGVTTTLFPIMTSKIQQELDAAKSFVDASLTFQELEDESWDTTMVAEYGEEIFDYMRSLEIKMLPNAHYMDNQAEIQWSMRSILVDWLVQVHHRFNLLPETLFLAVNYIDRFLSCKIVSLGKLQLVGATALFIAAKYEEINCPSVQEIVYMVDDGYSVDEVLKAERFMLTMLGFELGWPGPMSFLRRISKADDYDLETRTLAKYFLEVTVMDERFVGSPASFVAAGAHFLARLMMRKGDWTPAHVHYSGYTVDQLHPLMHMMVECLEFPEKHHAAVFSKYSDRRYKRASLFTEGEMQKGYVLPYLYMLKPETSLGNFNALHGWK